MKDQLLYGDQEGESSPDGQVRFLTAAQLLDGRGTAPLIDPVVRIEGDRITAVGTAEQVQVTPGAQVLDMPGCTLMPGMIDAHMHFFGVPSDQTNRLRFESVGYRTLRAAGEARRMLLSGVTSARCLGSSVSPDLRRAINEGHVTGPRLVTAGEFITSTAGTWDHLDVPAEWIKQQGMIADGPIEGRRIVRERVRQGANVIKIGLSAGAVGARLQSWGEDPHEQAPAYSLEEVRAITEEAHARGLKVSAHCIGDVAVNTALDGDVDIIEHGFGISNETRKRLVDGNVYVVSTLSYPTIATEIGARLGFPSWRRSAFERHLKTMRLDFEKGLRAGVRYALGTDAVGPPTHPQNAMWREFQLAVECGMEPADAIVAGTYRSAEVLGFEHDVGTIAPGYVADVIAVDGDPLSDMAALKQVRLVLRAGVAMT